MKDAASALTVHSRLRDYEVEFRPDEAWVADLCEQENAFVIVDQVMWDLHRDGCLAPLASQLVHTLRATEEAKTLESVTRLCDLMMERAAKRNSVIVSVGGGVVQDVTGFLASVMFRGVSWVFVPSTLLAQADSCIGAKTSLNYGRFKNLIGTMYPPDRVVVHTPLLATQGDDHYFSGLGEIVKLHIAKGPEAMAGLQRRIERLCARDEEAIATAVRASLLIKRRYIEEDEFDQGARRLLNFGHCFGHAIESATDFAVPHGQAVVLGMMAAGLAACRRGMLERQRLDEATAALFTPVLVSRPRFDGRLCRAVVGAMRHDKKRTGAGLAVVLPGGEWRLELVHDFAEGEALAALGELDRVLCHAGVAASSPTPGAQFGGGCG